MLVLSRKKNETVMVGDIPVTIVEIRGDKVRLGIEAPKEVPIDRLEIYHAKRREEKERGEGVELETDTRTPGRGAGSPLGGRMSRD